MLWFLPQQLLWSQSVVCTLTKSTSIHREVITNSLDWFFFSRIVYISGNKGRFFLFRWKGEFFGNYARFRLHVIDVQEFPLSVSRVDQHNLDMSNPLTPKIWLLILPSSFYTFPNELVSRICVGSEKQFLPDKFVNSQCLHVSWIMSGYYRDKLSVNHFWELKG